MQLKNYFLKLKSAIPRSTVLVLSSVLVIGISFSIGTYVGLQHRPEVDRVLDLQNKDNAVATEADFDPFWKAWNVLNEKFVSVKKDAKTVNAQAKVWGAIEGLAKSLGDPYTVFLPPAENEIFKTEIAGNFDGIGAEIGIKDGILTVITPLKDNPAYKAGVRSGDKILKIDKTFTNDLSVDEAIKLIRGKRGTTVHLTIVRADVKNPLDIPVIRDVIQIPNIETSTKPNGVFVISLRSFTANSPDQFRKALKEFVLSNRDKLILDLRGNPGGYLEAAVDMASWFLPEGKVIVREDFGPKQEESLYRSKGYNIFTSKLNFVILVDAGSASAAEILSGALQEHGVAKLVGTNTFGKGSVQELIPITEETNLKVTIARWLTPNGKSISDGGVKPDVEVKLTEDDIKNKNDAQMNKALELLKTGF